MISKLLDAVAVLCHRYHRLVFFFVLSLLAIALLLASRIELISNFIELVPQDSPVIKEFWEANEDFGAPEYLLALVENADSAETDPTVLKRFARLFSASLERLDMIENVDYSVTRKDRDFLKEFFARYAMLYLSGEDLDSVIAKLGTEEIEKQIAEDKVILSLPIPPDPGIKNIIREDPLMLSRNFGDYIVNILGQQTTNAMKSNEWYYLSDDKRTLLMLIKPTGINVDAGFSKRLMKNVLTRRDTVLAEMGADAKQINILFGGGYTSALANSQAIQKGFVNSLMIVLIGVLVTFYLFYGHFRALFYISVPVFIGVGVFFGFVYVTLGVLNLVTISCGAILMGLGMDYSIHIYNRFIEEEASRNKKTDVLENLRITFRETGSSIFYGAVSTAFVFAILVISEFKGLSQLGFLLASGILIVFLFVILMVPAIIRVRGRRKLRPGVLQKFFSKILDRLSHLVLTHPKMTLITIGTITLFMTAVLLNVVPSKDRGFGVTFDENTENLRSANDADVQVIKKLQEKFGTYFKPVNIICTAPTDKVLMEVLQRIDLKLDSLRRDSLVVNYTSISHYIPDIDQQKANIDRLAGLNVENIMTLTKNTIQNEKMNPGYFDLEKTRKSLSVNDVITLESLRKNGFDNIIDRYYIDKGDHKKVIIQVELNAPSHDNEAVKNLSRAFESYPNVTVTGARLVTAVFINIIKQDFAVAVVVSFFGILLVITVKYRKFWAVLLCIAPLVVAVLWMLGVMRLVGIRINFVNMVATPLIIGAGIDYGIYVVSRYLEDNKHNVFAAIHDTGQALFLSVLTSIIGFGSLMFIDNKGLASFGEIAVLGMSFCAVTSITLLPALLRLFGKKIWKIHS